MTYPPGLTKKTRKNHEMGGLDITTGEEDLFSNALIIAGYLGASEGKGKSFSHNQADEKVEEFALEGGPGGQLGQSGKPPSAEFQSNNANKNSLITSCFRRSCIR